MEGAGKDLNRAGRTEGVTDSAEQSRLFGRARELDRIRGALDDGTCSGILIEGTIGVGKTLLARRVYRERGGGDIWIRGDRTHQMVDFGALGLVVDLDGDESTLLGRIIATLTSSHTKRVVFVDDAHLLDKRTREVLSELVEDRAISLVAMTRNSARTSSLPFSELVVDRQVDHMTLEVLPQPGYRAMVEDSLGGIVSQGVVDIIAYHSGRNPGKLLELLEYTARKRRLLFRRGVWLLDGLDIDYDERARDYARIELAEYSQEQREALEIVIQAVEVDLPTMVDAGLGAAADSLVMTGEIAAERGERYTYVAVESHASDTIRFTAPVGRSRERFEFIAGRGDTPSDRARVMRTEWGLLCGVETDEHDIIAAARKATGFGDWLRAMRLLSEIPVDRLEPHELFDLARLYCSCNRIPIGLDILAQCVKKACCPSIVLEALVVWLHWSGGYRSPVLSLEDFATAVERLRTAETAHSAQGPSIALSHDLLARVAVALGRSRPLDGSMLSDVSGRRGLPRMVRVLDTLFGASEMLAAGRTPEAVALLDEFISDGMDESAEAINLRMLRVRALLQLGRIDAARSALQEIPTHDIAYLAARSGPIDLLWAQVHQIEGDLAQAMLALRASIEALDYWQQSAQLAIALAEAEYAVVRVGTPEAADELHARFDALPTVGVYHDYRRAIVLRIVARWLRTGENRYARELDIHRSAARRDGAAAIEVLICLCRFRHFDEVDANELIRVGGLGTGREFELAHALGTAVADRDGAALGRIAESYGPSMPDLGAKCRGLAARFLSPAGHDPDSVVTLTARELQVSRLIVDGRSNAEIAVELGVRVRTVEGHTYRLFRKLGISRRDEVAGVMRTMKVS